MTEIGLEQLLLSRDRRMARQLDLTREYPDRTLVSLTVVLPGPVKRDPRSLRIAEAGMKAVREALSPGFIRSFDLDTGFEAFFLVDAPLLEVKRACCHIEDTHPYGRLMDIDVIERTPEGVAPVGRDRVGEAPRRCLLCSLPARECIRARTHSTQDLLRRIDEILALDPNP